LIAGAVIVVALLSSKAADAQIIHPGPPGDHWSWWDTCVPGVHYDIANQAMAEHRLHHLQAKLRRDVERGDTAAADRDAHRIDMVKYRIAIDEWLIRWNRLQDPCFTPLLTDATSRAAIAQAASPAPPPPLPQRVWTPGEMAVARTITITIVNAGPAGANVAFTIGGVAHQIPGGSRQNLEVPTGSTITYDVGGSERRYLISPGLYEFRSTAEGWTLYKLAGTP
jgi:hypothetical protein